MSESFKNYAYSESVEDCRLSSTQVQSWRQRGFTLVHELLPSELLEQLKTDALDFYPEPRSDAAKHFQDFGSGQKFVFPAESAACNAVTLHPLLLQAVADLLGVGIAQLRLTQSDLWPKYGQVNPGGALDNTDQRIHCDYPNHSLLHPPEWANPEAVEIIIYLNDFDDCEGATAVVPRQGEDDPAYPWPITQTPGVAGLDYVNDREQAEVYLSEHNPEAAKFREQHLYPRELVAKYQFGSVLFYRHDTWHRGRPVKEHALRLVQNLTFTKVGHDWLNVLHPGWCWSMYRKDKLMEQLVAQATVEQRGVLGFPPPGHNYWTSQTVAAVEARYKYFGIDMTPYRDALSHQKLA
jgi:ectoine hydroxylase-related dioxygenase (phytanoyl-CoA dioxygenase family)